MFGKWHRRESEMKDATTIALVLSRFIRKERRQRQSRRADELFHNKVLVGLVLLYRRVFH